MMQIVNQEELALAQRIVELKSRKSKWTDIQTLTGLSKREAVKLLRKFNFRTVFYGNGSRGRREERNKLILDFVSSAQGKGLSQYQLAEYFAKNGRPDINRGVINGVIARARYSGLIESSKRCEVSKNGSLKPPRAHMSVVPSLPPRTPELLARGKVTWEELGPRSCRYTPTEEPPYLYCGAPQEYDNVRRQFRSWCKDCFESIIKRPEDEFLCVANDNAPQASKSKAA